MLDFCDHRVVFLGDTELDEFFCVVDVAGKFLDCNNLLFNARALARDDLRLLCVVPETRGERGVVQTFDFFFQLWNVKDAPLASSDAFGDLQVHRAIQPA